MANYCSWLVTERPFGVKDPEAFKKELEAVGVNKGADNDYSSLCYEQEGDGKFWLGGYDASLHYYDEEKDEDVSIVPLVQKHMKEGEIAVFMVVGQEKLRDVDGRVVVVTPENELCDDLNSMAEKMVEQVRKNTTINKKLVEFLHQKEVLKQLRRTCASGNTSLVIDFDKFLKFDLELAKTLIYNPVEFLAQANRILEDTTKIPIFCLRVRNLDKTLELGDIRAEHIKHFVQVSGLVASTGGTKFVKLGDVEEFEDYQEAEIGQNPSVNVVLSRDLVGKAKVGCLVVITGVVEAVQASGFYEPRIAVNHLEKVER